MQHAFLRRKLQVALKQRVCRQRKTAVGRQVIEQVIRFRQRVAKTFGKLGQIGETRIVVDRGADGAVDLIAAQAHDESLRWDDSFEQRHC